MKYTLGYGILLLLIAISCKKDDSPTMCDEAIAPSFYAGKSNPDSVFVVEYPTALEHAIRDSADIQDSTFSDTFQIDVNNDMVADIEFIYFETYYNLSPPPDWNWDSDTFALTANNEFSLNVLNTDISLALYDNEGENFVYSMSSNKIIDSTLEWSTENTGIRFNAIYSSTGSGFSFKGCTQEICAYIPFRMNDADGFKYGWIACEVYGETPNYSRILRGRVTATGLER